MSNSLWIYFPSNTLGGTEVTDKTIISPTALRHPQTTHVKCTDLFLFLSVFLNNEKFVDVQ